MPDTAAKTQNAATRKFSIATGDSRNSTYWHNACWSWEELVDHCRDPIVTDETLEQFLTWKNSQDKQEKARSSEAKDKGGFVGGKLKDGKRKKGCVESRSMICLDLDTVQKLFDSTEELINTLRVELPYTWLVYSTHSHQVDNPRLRLIIPLSEDITDMNAYQAIGRKIADRLGMPMFDKTTFEPNRLMYWPSCSCDARSIYVCEANKGKHLLDPNAVLRLYDTESSVGLWRDPANWALHPDEEQIISSTIADKQQSPKSKENIVGEFNRAIGDCRTAVEKYLSDRYTPGTGDRFTWIPGSEADGLRFYPDETTGEPYQFAYAADATDPANDGHLHSAFDLVRIHLFGEKDKKADPETPPENLPSFKAMAKWASDLDELRDQKLKEAFGDDFDEPGDADEEKEKPLYGKPRLTKDGEYRKTVNNIVRVIYWDPKLRGKIRYNEFSKVIEKAGAMPWGGEPGEWCNLDDDLLTCYLSSKKADFVNDKISKAVSQIAWDFRYNPVQEYFNALVWDGVERAESILIKYLGADDTYYTRMVTRKWLLAGVTRTFRPGTKFDYCLSITGEQGIGKSTLPEKLAGAWFSDALTFDDMKDEKSAAEKLRGVLIAEIGEMKGQRTTDAESIKAFISRSVDRFRPAYGRRTESHPRMCILIGTGNNADFLVDATGNRRFWPVPCKRQPHDPAPGAWDITPEIRGQIWAEVMTWFKKGEELELPSEVIKELEEKQRDATEIDERLGIVEKFLNLRLPADWYKMSYAARRNMFLGDDPIEGDSERQFVSIQEIKCECLGKSPQEKLDKRESNAIAKMLRQLGWVNDTGAKKSIAPYGRVNIFYRQE